MSFASSSISSTASIRAAIVALIFSAAVLFQNAQDFKYGHHPGTRVVPHNQQPDATDNKKNSTTAIVMFDNRGLDDVNLTDPHVYWRWAADLNHYYARQHGYDFHYLQSTVQIGQQQPDDDDESSNTKTRTTCFLEIPQSNVTEPRGAPWCKLLGIAAMLDRGYSTIIYIDSDAYFKLGSPNITTIIQHNSNATNDNKQQYPLVWFLNDSPWNPTAPNSGLQIWNNTLQRRRSAWQFLRQWWQTNTYPTSHPFEQQAVMELLQGQQDWSQYGAGLLTMNSMVKHNWKNPALPVVHITSIKKGSREKVMRPEWERIPHYNANDVLPRVSKVSADETFRLQRLLQVKVNETFGDIVAHRNNNQAAP